MTQKNIIWVSIVGGLAALVIIATVVLALVPVYSAALVSTGSNTLLNYPSYIAVYRQVDGVSKQSTYQNDDYLPEHIKKAYKEILAKLNSANETTALNAMFSGTKSLAPKVTATDLAQKSYNSVKNFTATADKIALCFGYATTQSVIQKVTKTVNGSSQEVEETRNFDYVFVYISKSEDLQTLNFYLFEKENMVGETMITYSGYFGDFFRYIESIPSNG